jgi:hypothetical protein
MHETEGNLMRKFLAVAAVVVLAVAVAVPAMALDFKFGGEYRVRFYSYINAGFDEGTGSNPRGAQVRVRPRFDASDDNGNITATLRLEIGDVEWGEGGGASGGGPANGYVSNIDGVPVGGTIFGNRMGTNNPGARTGNGTGGSLGADGVNVETKWAYIDAAMPFGIPLRVRAGIQPWFLPKGIIVDDDVSGLRFYGTSGPVSYDASWYRTSREAGRFYDNSQDFYNGKLDIAIAKWLNTGLYGGYGRNAATNPFAGGGGDVKTDLYYGLTVTGDFGFMKYDFDFVGGRFNGVTPINCTTFPVCASTVDASGYGFDAGVHFPIGPIVINVLGSWFTGDNQDGGIAETMPFISPSWSGAGNVWEMFGAGGVFDPVDLSQDYPAGTWTIGFNVEYRPVKALWLRVGYLYQNFTQNDVNCALLSGGSASCVGAIYPVLAPNLADREASLGHEIGFRADWDIWTGFKLQGQFGFWIPSKGDTTLEAALQMLYNF